MSGQPDSSSPSNTSPGSQTPPAQAEEGPRPSLEEGLLGGELESLENIVFLLYRDFGRFSDPGWVVIPVSQWENLKNEVARLQEKRPAASITSLAITGTLGENEAKLEMTLGVRVDDPKGAVIPLQMPEAQFTEVVCLAPESEKNTQPWVTKEKGGPYQLRIAKPGVYSYRIQMFVEIDRLPSQRQFRLSLPNAAVKRVELKSAVPLLFARNELTGQEYDLGADRNTLRLPLRADDSLNILWRTQRDRYVGGFSAYSVQGVLTCRVSDSLLETEALINVEARVESRRWSFLLPGDERIRSVEADADGELIEVESEVLPEKDRTRLRLSFAEPVSGQVQLRIRSDRVLQAISEPLRVGMFEMEGAGSQTGYVLIFSAPDLWIRSKNLRGLKKVAAAQLEPRLQRLQPRWSFRYDVQPAQLDLIVERARPVLSATSATDIALALDSARVRVAFHYLIRGAPVDTLIVRIPPEMSDLSVRPTEKVQIEEIRVDNSKKFKELVLRLAEPTTGDLDFELLGLSPVVPDKMNLLPVPLPGPDFEAPGTVTVRPASNVDFAHHADKSANLQLVPTGTNDRGGVTAQPRWEYRHGRGKPVLAFTPYRTTSELRGEIDSQVQVSLDPANPSKSEVLVRSSLRVTSPQDPFAELQVNVPASIGQWTVEGELLRRSPSVETETGAVRIPLVNPADRCNLTITYSLPLERLLSGDAAKKAPSPPEAEGESPPPLGAFDLDVPVILPEKMLTLGARTVVQVPRDWQAVLRPRSGTGTLPHWRLDETSTYPDRLATQSKDPSPTIPLSLRTAAFWAQGYCSAIDNRLFLEESGAWVGKQTMMLSQYRTDRLVMDIPPACRLLELRVDGESTPVRLLGDRQVEFRMPVGEGPSTVELTLSGDIGMTPGIGGLLEIAVPTLRSDMGIGDVRWQIETPRNLMLFARGDVIGSPPKSRFGFGIPWKFGSSALATPAVPGENNPASSESGDTTSPVGRATPEATAVQWRFATPGTVAPLQVWYARTPFWVLICSGPVLLFGAAIARLTPARQTTMAGLAVVTFLAMASLFPALAGWLWIGGQWGVYLVVVHLIYLEWNRRRRLRYYGQRLFAQRRDRSSVERSLDRSVGTGSASISPRQPSTAAIPSPGPSNSGGSTNSFG